MLSVLLKGELIGELLLVYVPGLFVPDDSPSLLDSVRHFR